MSSSCEMMREMWLRDSQKQERRTPASLVFSEVRQFPYPILADLIELPPLEDDTKPKRRKWGSFQRKFSSWVTGKGPKPDGIEYSWADVRVHLERQFAGRMSWINYAGNRAFRSKGVWHIDHIVPKRLFDESDVGACYALSNLRPLWECVNISKGRERLHLL